MLSFGCFAESTRELGLGVSLFFFSSLFSVDRRPGSFSVFELVIVYCLVLV